MTKRSFGSRYIYSSCRSAVGTAASVLKQWRDWGRRGHKSEVISTIEAESPVPCRHGLYRGNRRMKNMDRPYIFCHMMTSLDGKIMGKYMETPEGEVAGNVFDDIAFGKKAPR